MFRRFDDSSAADIRGTVYDDALDPINRKGSAFLGKLTYVKANDHCAVIDHCFSLKGYSFETVFRD